MTLFLLLAGHAVADYPLQGDFLARAKNHRAPIPGIDWGIALVNHALIHGAAVALVTGSVVLGIAEATAHCGIDWLKCDGRTSFRVDQALHVACKILWAALVSPDGDTK